MTADLSLPPLSLYVHLPWCVRKCPYCDFNSFQRSADGLPEASYVAALLADLDQDLRWIAPRPLHSIFFGGGTPSLFSGRAIADLLHAIAQRLPFGPNIEITLEANPGASEHDRFEAYREAGVNRLSLGVQSFDDQTLKRLGRIHDADQAERAYAAARQAGFERINLDLMYALPAQDLDGARADLQRALALGPEHLSYYHLTMEPNTAFHSQPPKDLPDQDLAFQIQDQGQQMLAEAGFVQYEISAYARPGEASLHNLNYWRFGDYLGIGAGAHGKLTRRDGSLWRSAKRRNPRSYQELANSDQRLDSAEAIADDQRLFEFMLNALRLREGVPAGLLRERTGLDPAQQPAIADARAKGLLVDDPGRLQASELGWRYLNDLQGMFLS